MEQPARRPAWTTIAGIGALMALLVYLAAGFRGQNGHVDEGEHVDQILRLARGEWTLLPSLTTVPGYHALMALFVRATGAEGVDALRADSLAVGLAAVAVFAACAHALTPDRALVRTWQWALFPILTPFLFLIYTDVTSMLFVLLALLAWLRGRPGWAGAAAIVGTTIRQTNVVWMLFFLVLSLWSAPDARPKRRWLWVYALGLAAFALFVWVNGGVAVGDKTSHPFPQVHASNVYFLLFLHFVFFLPSHLLRAREIAGLVRARPWIVALLAVGFPLFVLTFTNTHGLNFGNEQVQFFLRNKLLAFLVGPLDHMLLAYVGVVWAVLSLAVTPLLRPQFVLLYPFTLAFLVPMWLVEQRYTLIPFTFFLLMRERRSLGEELVTLAWMLPFTFYFLAGIQTWRFFL